MRQSGLRANFCQAAEFIVKLSRVRTRGVYLNGINMHNHGRIKNPLPFMGPYNIMPEHATRQE